MHKAHSNPPVPLHRDINGGVTLETLDAELGQAVSLGVNTLRLYGFQDFLTSNSTFPDGAANVMRKHGLRVVVTLNYDPKSSPNASLTAIASATAATAAAFKGHEWVLGFDLGNEPYFWDLGLLRVRENSSTTLADLCPL